MADGDGADGVGVGVPGIRLGAGPDGSVGEDVGLCMPTPPHLWDAGFGAAFIKIGTYCPWPMKIWVNGHEWAKQQARKIGFAFTELSNGFASAEDPAVLQKICDALQPGTINVFFQRWLARLPLPLGPADQRAGYWWELSMAQVEVSRTIVFTQPRHARAFFEALVTDNLDLGRPDTVEIIFGQRIINGKQRATQGTFKTKVITRGTDITINAFYRHSRIKQYLKDGRALRIETVINSPTDLRIGRRLHNLGELQDAGRAINTRLLHTERAGQGCVLANPVFERIAHPTVDAAGRRATAMRFGDSRVQALAGALCQTVGAVTGITNKSLRTLMTGLLGAPYSMAQASYDLARLSRNGLITRRAHANTYDLTPEGLAFAIFYTKVHDRVLAPLFAAGQPQAPPSLRAALTAIQHHIDNRLTGSKAARGSLTNSAQPSESQTQRVATLRPGLRPEGVAPSGQSGWRERRGSPTVSGWPMTSLSGTGTC